MLCRAPAASRSRRARVVRYLGGRQPVRRHQLPVPGPGGDHPRAQPDRTARSQVVPDDGQHEGGHPVGAVRPQPADGVAHPGVAEPFDQGVQVLVEVDPRHRVERGHRLSPHVLEQVLAQLGPSHRVVDEGVCEQAAEPGQTLVAGVEQPQLHQLVRPDVLDDLDVDLLQTRAAGGEVVLDDPLRERLRRDRPLVVEPEPGPQQLTVGVGGDRRDPVHHRVGEGDLVPDPRLEVRVHLTGEPGDGLPGAVTVPLQVVARQHGERRDARGPPPSQRLHDVGEGRPGAVEVPGVVEDVRVVGREGPVRGPLQVAALGHRQADDPHRWVDEPSRTPPQGRRRVVVLEHRADHPRLDRPLRMPQDQGVEPVLRGHHVPHRRVRGEQTDPADPPVEIDARAHQAVDVHRLVRPVEVAQPKVDDPEGPSRRCVTTLAAVNPLSRPRRRGPRGREEKIGARFRFVDTTIVTGSATEHPHVPRAQVRLTPASTPCSAEKTSTRPWRPVAMRAPSSSSAPPCRAAPVRGPSGRAVTKG